MRQLVPWNVVHELPRSLRKWNFYERRLLARGGDPARVRPDTSELDRAYLPESNFAIKLDCYWISRRRVHCFIAGEVPLHLKAQLFRTQRGISEVLLLVHPAAKSMYSEFIRRANAKKSITRYYGSPTSSSRTLLVWPAERGNEAFFAKLSLPVMIGDAMRTLSAEVVSRSIGHSMILDDSANTLPLSFKYLPELIGVAPKTLQDAGMIVRGIPKEVITGKVSYIPAFALYGHSGRRTPILLQLALRSGKDLFSYIDDKLLRPFARHWLDLVIYEGFVPEPHAQNLLLEVNGRNELTGNFVHRDFEAFYVDLKHRKRAQKHIPYPLPMVKAIRLNYKQTHFDRRILKSIHSYFQGGFLFMLDRYVQLWKHQGLVDTSTNQVPLEEQFMFHLTNELSARCGKTVRPDPRGTLSWLSSSIKLAKRKYLLRH